MTRLSVTREIRPGKLTLRDVDFRMPPNYPLLSTSVAKAKPVEADLESFFYVPGAFLFEGDGSDTPSADDKMAAALLREDRPNSWRSGASRQPAVTHGATASTPTCSRCDRDCGCPSWATCAPSSARTSPC